MPSLSALACPVCGAPIRPESPRCDYCGSIIVIETDHPRIDPHLLNRAVIDQHIARFRSSVRKDPNDETAHYGLGVAYFNLGLIEEAADELTQAARLMPENAHIQVQLATVFAQMASSGNSVAEQNAWNRVNRALLLQPQLVSALLLRADLHLRLDQLRDAVETWSRACEVDPVATRAPLTGFLTRHREIILRTPMKALLPNPAAPPHGARSRSGIDAAAATWPGFNQLSDQVHERRKRVWWLIGACIAFLGLCALLASIPTKNGSAPSGLQELGMLATLIGAITAVIIILSGRMRSLFRSESTASPPSHQQKLLMGRVADCQQLIAAAVYVVEELERRKTQRIKAEAQRQRHQESLKNTQAWLQQRQNGRANRRSRQTIMLRSGAGCGCLLPLLTIASFILSVLFSIL